MSRKKLDRFRQCLNMSRKDRRICPFSQLVTENVVIHLTWYFISESDPPTVDQDVQTFLQNVNICPAKCFRWKFSRSWAFGIEGLSNFPDFAPNSRKEWRLSLFNQFCENKLENCRKFWNLWKLFNIIQYYSFVSLVWNVPAFSIQYCRLAPARAGDRSLAQKETTLMLFNIYILVHITTPRRKMNSSVGLGKGK